MDYLPFVRTELTKHLWNQYKSQVNHALVIDKTLTSLISSDLILDHFAIIDLPSETTGLSFLSEVFTSIGYTVQGKDYLEEKQNEFMWLSEIDAHEKPIKKVLPQVVVADFWLDKMPSGIRKIIEKYTKAVGQDTLPEIRNLSRKSYLGDQKSALRLMEILILYFERDRPLPTLNDFKNVRDYNELLAWVLVFGRQPNHFALNVHLMEKFESLKIFNSFIENEMNIDLNKGGGPIKGSKELGIEQSSTKGAEILFQLADGPVYIPDRFVEFVWRYPKKEYILPQKWQHYFTGFITKNADKIVESVYRDTTQ